MTDLLTSTVMPYPWGSRTAIADLIGRPTPSTTPEAELWMGAHPVAPSRCTRHGVEARLDAIIAADPERELGSMVVRELGPRLPFLLKVLAAAEPLSLQAHPNAEQARAGWEDEERRGIPRDAPHRNYRDTSHKPELFCALTPVDALSGFRAIEDTLSLLDALAVPELEPFVRPLRSSPDAAGLAETFQSLMTMPIEARSGVVDATARACVRPDQPFVLERAWVARLAALYPGDVGVVSALLLELVHLEPGDALYLEAGNLHAYLEGTGVEIMASSDNVLRGGLTKKHVDVPELLRVLTFGDSTTCIVRPRPIDEHEVVYDTPAREFRLSKLHLPASTEIVRAALGPEILLVVDGAPLVDAVAIEKGGAVFVPASTGRYQIRCESEHATIFRATTNLI